MILIDFFDCRVKLSEKIDWEGILLFRVVELKFSDIGVFIRVVWEFDVLTELVGEASEHD